MKNDSNPIIRSEKVTIDIRRVDVYRGYQINISFNFDLTPYIEGE